jgi:chemotaxis protein methyltransferase CheR
MTGQLKSMSLTPVKLSDKQFKKVVRIVYRISGINLQEGKQAMVRTRLMKRVRALQLDSIDAYLKYIESAAGTAELGFMIDAMTINKTSFFREAEHFKFLRENILPEICDPRLRFWSAACSSGEEPYSLAITLRESSANVDSRDCLILATDISNRMLENADRGVYGPEALRDLPPYIVQKYFNKMNNGDYRMFQVKKCIRAMVRLARLNLMAPWPMKGPFNVIYCRNVMFYFEISDRQTLINRFWDILAPGGYLFVGHSEGLAALSHKFHYVRPAIYRK